MRHLICCFLFFIVFYLASPLCEAVVIGQDLQAILQTGPSTQEVPVIIHLADKADPNLIPTVAAPNHPEYAKVLRRHALVKALKDKADKTQGPLRAFLNNKGVQNVKALWITNSIAATVPVSVISELMSMPEIASIVPDAVVRATPLPQAAASSSLPPQWNVVRVHAPDLWSAGITGSGAVVASLDSGVDLNHPDLKPTWRGGYCSAPPNCPSWYDPYNNTTLPYAVPAIAPTTTAQAQLNTILIHGTATMGIMVGGPFDPSGPGAIGVAPGAQWISAKIFDDATGQSTTSIILGALQWVLAPEGDAANAPDVVSNSWVIDTSQNVCDTTFQTALSGLTAAGIEVVFAAGNVAAPPATAPSSFSPANNPGVFAVGATVGSVTDFSNSIASFSALGQSACDGTNGPLRSTNFPNIVAPGGSPSGAPNIQSSVPLGSKFFVGQITPSSYTFLTGTSIAAPHASGAAALLTGAIPALTTDQIETAFEQSALALPAGTTPPNNTYGYGLLNAAAAYQYAFTHYGPGSVPRIAGVPSSVDFINATGSTPFTVVIANQGTADLTISGVSFVGTDLADFAITGDTCLTGPIASLSSCSISATFSGASGPIDAFLSISSTDPVTPTLDIPLRDHDPVARAQGTGIVATYATIQTAVANSSSWDTIRMQTGTLTESPVFDLPFSLQGGYDPAFGTQAGLTTVQGDLAFSHGTVLVGNVTVQGTITISSGSIIAGSLIVQ
jgi:serine protease AprX